ncbi:pyridoxamine 5'-phosphate oxidase family protein [Cognatiyoonia sp. IB215446]|uniref:pyridoxamine 5'-phosphate oxidase family protein n=1 Tax=Cognatiyoonia sp. IB215446 TaxID=3097355 RepID=UPI002A0B1E9D|nr:pyridoxamine 5'-phosphate oxidase family protein [Cognatiyoonia sp. IB215446]MDX8350102.1 pyridoxamine 5'-phosphate oxidase family protein [Cognatiyoonia sp. IB215446]
MAIGPKLNTTLRNFIEKQHVFFVATAAADGRVNVSPKGMDSLRIIDNNRIVWLNLTGSGNETAAHLRDVNRMTLMFCAFEGDALILRVYGHATTLHPHDISWDGAIAQFPPMAGSRQIFNMTIDMVQTSCGTGVPLMTFEKQRGPEELLPYYADMGEDGVQDYWRRKNVKSIDGSETGIFSD